MHTKPAIPENVEPGSGHYSFATDLRVNGWAAVAALTSFAGEVLLPPRHESWPTFLHLSVALIPLVAGLLWVRSITRWLRGMDELHRRITTAAAVFATATTLFAIAGCHALALARVIPATFQASAGFVIIWLVLCFYLIGRRVFNRSYQ
jgi:hypothetical protein